jgi:hypothetical protein
VSRKEPERAIANLIASTRTKQRNVSLVEFYAWLTEAIARLGSLEDVAAKIGVSTRMLKQFLVVGKLDNSVLTHVKQRSLDSIDALNYLARFSHQDQRAILPLLLTKELSSKDLRSVYQQRSVLAGASIPQLVTRVSAGKARRVYELNFLFRGGLTKEQAIDSLKKIVMQDGLERIESDGPFGKVLLTKIGLDRLRAYSRAKGIPFKRVLAHLLHR